MSKKPRSIFKRAGSAIWDKLLETYEPDLFKRRQEEKSEKHKRRSKELSNDSKKENREWKEKEHSHHDSRLGQHHRGRGESGKLYATQLQVLTR